MKNTFTNPLKTFNDNNALAVKKMGGAQAAFKKSLPKAQPGMSVGSPTYKTWTIGETTPSGQSVKTQQDIDRLNKMERINSYGRPVDKYTKPVVKPIPKQKTGGATKATKFAALAPPFNKATFADRIVGAKKNKKK